MRLEGLRASGQRIWERLEDTFSTTVRRSEVRSASVHNRQSKLGDSGPKFYHHRPQPQEDAQGWGLENSSRLRWGLFGQPFRCRAHGDTGDTCGFKESILSVLGCCQSCPYLMESETILEKRTRKTRYLYQDTIQPTASNKVK